MPITVNRYNEPVMNAVNFIAGETANKKRQERQSQLNMEQDKAYLGEKAKWDAVFNKFNAGREDDRNRLTVLGNLMGNPNIPADQFVGYNTELNKRLGIDTTPVAESTIPFSPLVQKYYPDLMGTESQMRPETIELINDRAQKMEEAALRQQEVDNQQKHYQNQAQHDRDYLTELRMKQEFEEKMYDKQIEDQTHEERINYMTYQHAKLTEEVDALAMQREQLQGDWNPETKSYKYNKKKANKNAAMVEQLDRRIGTLRDQINQLQTSTDQMRFSSMENDTLVTKQAPPPGTAQFTGPPIPTVESNMNNLIGGGNADEGSELAGIIEGERRRNQKRGK